MAQLPRRSGTGTPPRKPLPSPLLHLRRRSRIMIVPLSLTICAFLLFFFLRPSLPVFSASALRVYVVAPPSFSVKHVESTVQSLRAQRVPLDITIVHPGLSLSPRLASLSQKILPLNNPYDAVLSLPTDGSPPLYVHAGTRLAPHALTWLKEAQLRYAGRPDIAAFFLDGAIPRVKKGGADHEPSSWEVASISNQGALKYQLAVHSAAFVPNYGRDMKVWETFSEWLKVRRGDWYKYPDLEGTPLGMQDVPERNWTRGAWNVWMSLFMREYGLYAMYPNVGGKSLAVNERLDASRDMRSGTLDWGMYEGKGVEFGEVRRYGGDGKEVVGGGLIGRDNVERVVSVGKEQGGMISFTMVSKTFLDTAKSWLCNVEAGGFKPKGLVWGAVDEESKEVGGGRVVKLQVEGGGEFGNPGYWKLMLERTALIGEVLNEGVAVFNFETDAVWLEDPMPYVRALESEDADIVGTINTRMEVSGNFFYLRPTLATRRMWMEIVRGFEKAYRDSGVERKARDSWTYIENDQSLLTKLVLRNDTWRRGYPLRFLTLDMERFVDGRWYKPEDGFYKSERARKPVVVNNNFVIGVDEKTKRAKKWGHWFWDENKKVCLKDAVKKVVRKSSWNSAVVQAHDGAHRDKTR